MDSSSTIASLRRICDEVGFSLAHVDARLIERMKLLHEHSETYHDAERMARLANDVFDHYLAHKPEHAFDPLERQTVVLGSTFADIGKTGPLEADTRGQRLVVEMFAIENVTDDTQSITSFLTTHFPDDARQRQACFLSLELDPNMSLREFWNLHSGWTLAIAETYGLPMEAVAAAATHHLLDNVNPRAIVDADGRFTRRFGENPSFDRAEKLVILLDKYDALRRRGKRSHPQAIAWLREMLGRNPRFSDDRELHVLLDDLERVLAAS